MRVVDFNAAGHGSIRRIFRGGLRVTHRCGSFQVMTNDAISAIEVNNPSDNLQCNRHLKRSKSQGQGPSYRSNGNCCKTNGIHALSDRLKQSDTVHGNRFFTANQANRFAGLRLDPYLIVVNFQ